MLSLNFNKFINYKILLSLLIATNLFGNEQKQEIRNPNLQLSQAQISHELLSIIKLEHKNRIFRKFGYTAIAAGTSYYLFKNYFSMSASNANQEATKKMNKAQEDAINDLVNFIDTNSQAEKDGKEEIGAVHDNTYILTKKSYYFGVMKAFCKFFLMLDPEQKQQLFNNLTKLSHVEPQRGYISGFFHGIWGLGTSIGFQLALGATIAWTGKNFYKHFMPLSYEYFITHHTNFEQALEMVNSCTLLDPEKAQDPLYVELSKENLKLAYSHLIKEGQKLIAFMLYTRIKNKNMVQVSRTTLDNLTENFKNNLSDISNFIETHNLLAIRNRVSAINNTSKMFVNFETVLEN